MKKFFQFIPVIMLFIITGCSYTYKAGDFASKDEYFSKINSAIEGRSVKAELFNDSVIVLNEGAVLVNDSLFTERAATKKIFRKIPLSQLSNIYYSGKSDEPAVLLLRNGEKLPAYDLKAGNDSISFGELQKIIVRELVAPVNSIKLIKYHTHSGGVVPGLVAGLGIGLGAAIQQDIKRTNGYNPGTGYAAYSAAGILAGGIIGYVLGWDYVYLFNAAP